MAAHVMNSAPRGDVRQALEHFNAFSLKHGLGMHLGEEKGSLVELAVAKGLPPDGRPAVVFEAGCHAGDGTLNAAAALLTRPASTIVSTEANKEWLAAAEKVVGHATDGLGLQFVPMELADGADFGSFLDDLRLSQGIDRFDAVILDHDEAKFLEHLKTMRSKGFLRKGSTIYVDNVKRKIGALRPYMSYVDSDSGNGFKTEVKSIRQPYPDAVAISTVTELLEDTSTEL